ncbi:hypothetical protein LCGC14_2713940, partial [marine sediment metagenome]
MIKVISTEKRPIKLWLDDIEDGLGNPESFHSCSHGAGRRM